MNTWKREDWLRWLSAKVIPQSAAIYGLSPAQQAAAVEAVESITTLERELAEAKKENGRLRTQLAACASDAKAALRIVRFTGEGVYGDYYTDEQE